MLKQIALNNLDNKKHHTMKQQKHMTACRGIHSHQVNSDTNQGGKNIEKNEELKTNQEVNCETKRRNT